MKKKVVALFLALVMALSLLPTVVLAEPVQKPADLDDMIDAMIASYLATDTDNHILGVKDEDEPVYLNNVLFNYKGNVKANMQGLFASWSDIDYTNREYFDSIGMHSAYVEERYPGFKSLEKVYNIFNGNLRSRDFEGAMPFWGYLCDKFSIDEESGEITADMRDSVTNLDLSTAFVKPEDVSALKNLEYFFNMETLNVSSLTNLNELDLTNCPNLKTVTVTGCTSLQTITMIGRSGEDGQPANRKITIVNDGAELDYRIVTTQQNDGPGGPPFAKTVDNFIQKNFSEKDGVWSPVDASVIASEWGMFDDEVHRYALEAYPWLGQVLSDIGIVVPITKTYILSDDTAIDITIPECLVGLVILPDELAANNVLTVTFKDDITAEDWKNVYYGSMMRDFAMLSYTFRYIGQMNNPAYYTWNGQNEQSGTTVAAAAEKAAQYCEYGHDRGITNAIVVAKFQNDGEMMVLPGNTNVNATSHEIISWEDSPNAYSFLTDVVDTSNVTAMELDINPTQNYGENGNWLDKLGSPTDSVRVSLPQVNGMTMTVNNGLIWTEFATTTTLEVEDVLAATVGVAAPTDAVQYRMVGNYTSTEPDATADTGSDWEVNSMKEWLAQASWTDVSVPIILKPNTLEEQTVGNVSYYIGENITGVHCTVIEWEMSDGSFRTEYIYFNAAPYVRTIETESVDEITAPVTVPTAVSEDDFTLNCRIFPQNNENAYYFRLSVWEDNSKVTTFDGQTTYTIYIPYDYIGYSWEEAQQNTAKPAIQHYDDSHNLLETIEGEYTEFGVKFETTSFSPFVLSWEEGEEPDPGHDPGHHWHHHGHHHWHWPWVKPTPTPTPTPTPGHSGGTTTSVVSAPDTGDAGIAIYGVMSVMSLMGMGYLGKRKKH